MKEAAGFVWAGVEYRYLNITETVWKPVDVVLRSRFLSGLFIVVPTLVVAFEVLTTRGR